MVIIDYDLLGLELREKVFYLLNHHKDYKEFTISENQYVCGHFDKKYLFDFVLKHEDSCNEIGIIVKDWRRSIDYRTILKVEKILKTTKNITKVLLVGRYFSDFAQLWAERLNIPILSSGELDVMLNSIDRKFNLFDA